MLTASGWKWGLATLGDLDRHGVVGNAETDLLRARSDDVWHIGLLLDDDGQGTGQECLDELVRVVVEDRYLLHHRPVGDGHGEGHVEGSLLGKVERLDGGLVVDVRADTVDGVGGVDDKLTVGDGLRCGLCRTDAFLVESLRDVALVDAQYVPSITDIASATAPGPSSVPGPCPG